jgi:hypothetical protein
MLLPFRCLKILISRFLWIATCKPRYIRRILNGTKRAKFQYVHYDWEDSWVILKPNGGATSYKMALLMGKHVANGFVPTAIDISGGYKAKKWPCKTLIAGYVTFEPTPYSVAGNITPMRLPDNVDFQKG